MHRTALLELGTRSRWFPVVPCDTKPALVWSMSRALPLSTYISSALWTSGGSSSMNAAVVGGVIGCGAGSATGLASTRDGAVETCGRGARRCAIHLGVSAG